MWPECQEEDLEEQHPEMDTASESDADEYSADAAKGTWSFDSDSDDEAQTRDRTEAQTRKDRTTGAWAVFV